MPPTLYETYDRILEKLLPLPLEARKIAQKTLHWIALGRFMTVDQLCEAVSIPDAEDEMDSDDIVDESEIVRRCSSLIRKSFDGTTFEFAHFTVLEYLQNITTSSPLEFFRFSKAQALSSFLSTSFRFLTFPIFDRRPLAVPADLKSMAKRNEKHPFYPRAAKLFLHQMSNEEHEAFGILLQTSSFFQYAEKLFDAGKPGTFVSWVIEGAPRPPPNPSLHPHDKYPLKLATRVLKPDFTPLHIAASLSQPTICRFLLERGVDVNSESDLGTPLHFCLSGPSIFGSLPHGPIPFNDLANANAVANTLALLLEHGADPTLPWRSRSALAVAVKLSLRTLDVKVLLSLLQPTTTIPNDVVEEFELLGGRGLNDEYLSELLDGLLDKFAQFGKSSSLSRLLPSIQRITKRRDLALSTLPPAMQYVVGMSDKDVLDAIRVAVESDLGDDLKTLLAHTATAERKLWFRMGDVPVLHLAARNDSKRAAAVLLDSGVDVDVTDNQGRTALHICCERNCAEAARVLLERGARIDLRSGVRGQISWHLAARHESADVLLLLFEFDKESGRNLATISSDGQTPLAIAILSGAPRASRLILERCQQPYDPDIFQSTRPLLHSAVSFGNQELFTQLIESGVSFPETSADGSTPLHHLRPDCHMDFVRYLISRYDPLQARHDGKIALELLLLQLNKSGLQDDEESCVENLDGDMVNTFLPKNHILPRSGTPGLHVWDFLCDQVISRFGRPCHSKYDCGRDDDIDSTSSYVSYSSNNDGGNDSSDEDETVIHVKIPCRKRIVCSAVDALAKCGVLASFEAENNRPAFVPLFLGLLARKGEGDAEGESIRCLWVAPVVKKVLETQPSLGDSPTDPVFRALLMRAILGSNAELVSVLLERDPDVHSPVGLESPIEAACRVSVPHTFRAVLKHVDKARINDLGPHGQPLISSVIHGDATGKAERLKALFQLGADPNLAPVAGKLSLIARAAEKGQPGVVDTMLDFGADPYSEDIGGNTLANSAVLSANFRLLKMLRQGNAPPGYWTKTCSVWFMDKKQVQWGPEAGCTLLHCGVLCPNSDMAQYLMDEGISEDVNVTSQGGLTGLHLAALRGGTAVVKFLVERGADVNIRDNRGWLPVDCAFAVGDFEVARVLVEAGSKESSILQWAELQATWFGDSETPGWRQKAFSPAFRLESAIVTGHLEECKAIIKAGCSVDVILPSCHGCPPLFCAIRAKKPAIISWLLSNGANPGFISCQRHPDHGGVVQLATHCLGSAASIDQLLTYTLNRGLDVFDWARTPLHVAAHNQNLTALTTIISHIRKNEKEYRYVNAVLIQSRRLLSFWRES